MTGSLLLQRLIRVFSTNASRKAPEEEIANFNSEADVAAMKGGSEIDEKTVSKFPTIDQMSKHPGKKDGEMRVFREGRTN